MMGVAKLGSDGDLIVQGHTIVQIKYSESTKKILDEIYSKISTFSELFSYYVKNSIPPMQIEMKITQNQQLADLLIQNMKKELGEIK